MSASFVVMVVLGWSLLRLAEFVLSERNMGPLLVAGGVEHCDRQHRPLLVVNAIVPMMAMAALAWHERTGSGGPLGPWSAVALVVLLVAEALHWWAIVTLGTRWTTGVVVIPGERAVTRGPYRLMRHPGYAGGATSGALLPLVAGSLGLALVAATLLGAVVLVRVRCEDAAWRAGIDGPEPGSSPDSGRATGQPAA